MSKASDKYDVVIGLEIHAELNTKTKLLCGCANEYGAKPNTRMCNVCLGYDEDGISVNQEAVRKTIKAGLALGCKINNVVLWDRKFYSYVDSPKGFQTTQLHSPICVDGGFKLKNGKFAGIKQIHLEEDAGKLVHEKKQTWLDSNRGGVPLNEIVTLPVFSNADEVVEFLDEVRSRLVFADVANCKMEEGGMRFDVSLSVKPKGQVKLGNRTETKNLNSFKMAARAIEYEQARQIEMLEEGKTIEQETLRWDDVRGITYAMRKKENEGDYNYTPDKYIPIVEISDEDIEEIRKEMPMLKDQVSVKLKELGLSDYEAEIISRESSVSTFYFDCLNLYNKPKELCNWVLNNVLAKAKSSRVLLTANQLVGVINLVESKKITKINGVALIDALWNTDLDALKQADKMGLTAAIDNLDEIVIGLIKENQAAVADFSKTPDKVINFLIGQTMRKTGGKADAAKVKEIVCRKLQ